MAGGGGKKCTAGTERTDLVLVILGTRVKFYSLLMLCFLSLAPE